MEFRKPRRFSIVGFCTLLLLAFCHGSAENWDQSINPIAARGTHTHCLLDFYTDDTFAIAQFLAHTEISSDDQELLELGQLIVDKAREIDVDPYLILAMIQVESTFDPCARSYLGAKGLMQVMPHRILGYKKVRREFAFKNHVFYDPHWNISFGVDYLGSLLQRFGSIETALTAYNAGPTRVSGWLNEPGETIQTEYSKRVVRRYHSLKPSDES